MKAKEEKEILSKRKVKRKKRRDREEDKMCKKGKRQKGTGTDLKGGMKKQEEQKEDIEAEGTM